MKRFRTTLYTEYYKAVRSKVFWGTLAGLSLAPVMGSLFVVVLQNPVLSDANGALKAKAALSGFTPDWPSFLNLISQAISIGGIIVFGFATSWIFGREYADKTLKDMLVLPVSRTTIVLSKMAAVTLWSWFICIVILLEALLFGFLLNLDGWSLAMFKNAIYAFCISALLTVLLNPPVAFIAGLAKGYLGPLAFVILTIVLAQIIGALGLGAYFPWAVPAIYSKILGASALNIYSYVILVAVSAMGLAGVLYWWNYADQSV